MANRKNRDFGELRETAPTDEDFFRGVGEHMGTSRTSINKKIVGAAVWFVVIAFLAMTVLSTMQVNNNRLLNVELKSMIETQYNPSFKTRYADLGKEVIDAWYASNPSPSPVLLADGISWPHGSSSDLSDFEFFTAPSSTSPGLVVRNVTYIGGRQEKAPDNDKLFYEINMYSAYVDGTLSNIAVTFAIPDLEDYMSLPTLMSEPSIFPNKSAIGDSTKSTQPQWRNVSESAAFKAQLESWAKAYSTNDSGTLKQITGDSSGSFYIGAISAKQWEYVEGSAKAVWVKENLRDINQAVAQVTWKMKLPDVVIPNADRATSTTIVGATQTQRMEILIQAPESGLPLIVAWGAVGSFNTLNADTNRLTEEEFNRITSAVRAITGGTGTPAPTPTPGTTEEPSDDEGSGVDEPTNTNSPSPSPTDGPQPGDGTGTGTDEFEE